MRSACSICCPRRVKFEEFKNLILFEDNHLLVVSKPTQLVTMGADADQPSLFKSAKQYIKQKYDKPGNVYLGVVSRLDSLVSGAIVFARTSKAAARLNEQFANGTVSKIYLAIVEGEVREKEKTLEDWIRKDDKAMRMRVVSSDSKKAKFAKLNFRRLISTSKCSLLAIQIETCRKHQIRLQMSNLGHPIKGDRKYDGECSFHRGIALHSWRLALQHPTLKETMNFEAPLPSYWRRLELVQKFDFDDFDFI